MNAAYGPETPGGTACCPLGRAACVQAWWGSSCCIAARPPCFAAHRLSTLTGVAAGRPHTTSAFSLWRDYRQQETGQRSTSAPPLQPAPLKPAAALPSSCCCCLLPGCAAAPARETWRMIQQVEEWHWAPQRSHAKGRPALCRQPAEGAMEAGCLSMLMMEVPGGWLIHAQRA
jgi:hypothetical protein